MASWEQRRKIRVLFDSGQKDLIKLARMMCHKLRINYWVCVQVNFSPELRVKWAKPKYIPRLLMVHLRKPKTEIARNGKRLSKVDTDSPDSWVRTFKIKLNGSSKAK